MLEVETSIRRLVIFDILRLAVLSKYVEVNQENPLFCNTKSPLCRDVLRGDSHVNRIPASHRAGVSVLRVGVYCVHCMYITFHLVESFLFAKLCNACSSILQGRV